MTTPKAMSLDDQELKKATRQVVIELELLSASIASFRQIINQASIKLNVATNEYVKTLTGGEE